MDFTSGGHEMMLTLTLSIIMRLLFVPVNSTLTTTLVSVETAKEISGNVIK